MEGARSGGPLPAALQRAKGQIHGRKPSLWTLRRGSCRGRPKARPGGSSACEEEQEEEPPPPPPSCSSWFSRCSCCSSFLPSLLPSFLASFLASFLPCFLPSLLPCFLALLLLPEAPGGRCLPCPLRPSRCSWAHLGRTGKGPGRTPGSPLRRMALHRSQKLNLLRLVVLLTVVLAGIKFFFRDSFTLDQHKESSGKSSFWGDPGDFQQSARVKDPSFEFSDSKGAAGARPETRKQPLQAFSSTPMRLVHLDLKGAAPKVAYLEQIFPLFSKLGANGVLIEYEDMFPFTGELEILRSPYAYSEEDIGKVLELAERNKLEVIPLVQTFGHVEFILKHDKYRHLREVERFPNSFNPHVPETLAVVKAVLTQVLNKHRRSHWVHIGADEVFHLGEGMDSKNWMSRNAGDVGKIYLNHIREVVSFVAGQPGGFQALLWDDMLRKVSVAAIQDSGIAKQASPMLWFYAPDFDTQQIGKYIAKYAECGFKTIWFASSFKGTTGPAQAWPPLNGHLQNHLRWLKVIQSMATTVPSVRFQGIAVTGWQRYDHYSALCELLPVGIPSLAVCLQTLVNGGFTDATKKKVLAMLGFQNMNMETGTCEGNGAFPGSDIYRMVEQVDSQLRDSVVKVLEEESTIKGWFSPYHRKHQFGNPRNLESFGSKVLKVHEDWESLIQTLRSHMEAIYFPDTVEEWMEENVNPHMDRLREFVRDFKETIRLNARPKTL